MFQAATFDLVTFQDHIGFFFFFFFFVCSSKTSFPFTEKSEVREDPEQRVFLEKTLEMLVAAGYFRARLPVLSSFDKVLGGLAWAIAGSAVDVDVDVFFDDNATLGEKNSCAEDVCRALIRMKCPVKLQSFQITRSDWKSVHPVVVWVIKTVLETREERQQQTRRLALFKSSPLPADLVRAAARPAAASFLEQVGASLGPRRRFRSTQTKAHTKVSFSFVCFALFLTCPKESDRVQDVLREYGTLGSEASGAGGGGDALTQGSRSTVVVCFFEKKKKFQPRVRELVFS
jgi:hypothetical protein